jgi:hypothetical protein
VTLRRRRPRRIVAGLLALALTACVAEPSPTATPATPEASPTTPAASPSAEPSATASPSGSPSPTPEPPLSLPLPETRDERVVAASVAPQLDATGGTLTVTVTSAAAERIDELVLRWPTELDATLRIAPFVPSPARTDSGQPLVQQWTKWVIGPGEEGEPEGTISLGWGPLLAGATLEIELIVTRLVPGPVAFDLQVLAGNDLLALDGGEPAELRVEVP